MNTLSRLDKDDIISRINIQFFYESELGPIQRSRRNGWAPVKSTCPFHADKKPGTFEVNTHNGHFKCWACNASGDLIAFVMQTHGLDFVSALKFLSDY